MLTLLCGVARAAPLETPGRWFEASPAFRPGAEALTASAELRPVDSLSRTGGRFLYEAWLRVEDAGVYVLDFRSSSTIARFQHWLFDADGELVATHVGGIESAEPNPFFLRHGREVTLAPGAYRLVSEIRSPFLLAQPEPYLDPLASYRQAIKPGNALVLVCLGVFLGLGLYYAALATFRRRLADAMYAAFILGNLLYNGTVLLVYPELFGMRWFYLVSVPILLSNIAYVLFVLSLLEIRRPTHPTLYRVAIALVCVLASAVVLAAVFPSWSLELDRYGVGLFASFGLAAAIVRAREGNATARYYLLAIVVFFVLGLLAISLTRLDADTFYVEHLGLVAVVVEVCLLGLVLAHQFALVHHEKELAQDRAEQNSYIAYNDALTGLPNRYLLDVELRNLPLDGSLTFIDLDGLKLYNDRFGHQRGDALLRSFAQHLKRHFADDARVYRLSGDEFAVTCDAGDLTLVATRIDAALLSLRQDGFELAGASFGSAHAHEGHTRDVLKHLADTRMYEQKHKRRERGAERQHKLA